MPAAVVAKLAALRRLWAASFPLVSGLQLKARPACGKLIVPCCSPLPSSTNQAWARVLPFHPEHGSQRRNLTSTVNSSGGITADVMATSPTVVINGISHLTQAQAAAVDEELFSSGGFSVDQLMELAGLSCACAIAEVYPTDTFPSALILAGPGNNGGDGLVIARHLHHFGYKVHVCYPKRTPKPLYDGLVKQLENLKVPFLDVESVRPSLSVPSPFNLLVDAIFGFSFTGSPRPPFDAILSDLSSLGSAEGAPPLVSVDIPSGWDVQEGDQTGLGLKPNMLISLTAPKLAARTFSGQHHFLGGRFVPPSIVEKYSLQLPGYPGSAPCVRISVSGAQSAEHVPEETVIGAEAKEEVKELAGAASNTDGTVAGASPTVDVASLRKDYVGRQLLEDDVLADPMEQFRVWFEEAVAEGVPEPNGMALCTVDANGAPSCRIVLLKGFDNRGLVWYTNYQSRKAQDLSATQRAAITFWWERQNRQVRVEGSVEKVSSAESDEYFHSRPRGSQVGALASVQSSVVNSRKELDEQYEALGRKYLQSDDVIPRPETWGGFRLSPTVVEFWQGRSSRLHDRLQFTKTMDGEVTWVLKRLAP